MWWFVDGSGLRVATTMRPSLQATRAEGMADGQHVFISYANSDEGLRRAAGLSTLRTGGADAWRDGQIETSQR
jgi:hypothetical protein